MSRLGRLPKDTTPVDGVVLPATTRFPSRMVAIVSCITAGATGALALLYARESLRDAAVSVNLALRLRRSKENGLLSGYNKLLHPVVRPFLCSSQQCNLAVVEIIEFVRLPRGSTHSCHELNMPVKGEIRLHTDLVVAHAVKVRINTKPAARKGTASLTASTLTASGGANRVPLENIVLSELVDRSAFATTSELALVPGNTQTNFLVSYESISLDSLLPPVCVKDCALNPASAPQSYNLSFSIAAYNAAHAVEVEMILPKGAQVLEVAHQSMGRWGRFSDAAPSEYHWEVGDLALNAPPLSPDIAASPRTHPEIVIRFSLTYCVPATSGQESRTGSIDHEGPNPLIPAITLTYQSPESASGLRLRKFSAEPTLSCVSAVAKVESSAVYRTCFCQEIPVDSSL